MEDRLSAREALSAPHRVFDGVAESLQSL
jgi:hypothetical protein